MTEDFYARQDIIKLKKRFKKRTEDLEEQVTELKGRNNFLARIMRENGMHEAKCDAYGRANAPEGRTFFYSDKPCNCWLSIDLDLTT